MTTSLKKASLGLACALALAAPGLALAAEPEIHGVAALHEFDMLIVFASGLGDYAEDIQVRLGSVDGWADLGSLCDVGTLVAGEAQIQCRFPGGLPPEGGYVVEVATQGGLATTQGLVTIGAPGPVGPEGPVGPQGPQGPVGNQGPAGPQGVAGLAGAQGPQGPQGIPGAAGVAGEDGPAGDRGSDGAQGPTGDSGAQGLPGLPGIAGAPGSVGEQGPQGPAGAAGAQGLVGPQGAPGAPGVAGSAAALPLLARAPLPAGEACRFGGTSVFAGIDANGNGVLDEGEVQSTGVLCFTPGWNQPLAFASCGATGRFGPAQADCDAAYTGTDMEGQVEVVGGIQRWTVPHTGTYRIEAAGAQGGYLATVTAAGGLGSLAVANVVLEEGDVLEILVGQSGFLGSPSVETGGGGGSFVVLNGEPLLVAGGGGSHGGCGSDSSSFSRGSGGTSATRGADGKAFNPSQVGGAGGENGNGGLALTNSFPGGAGGGFQGDGAYGTRNSSNCVPAVLAGQTGIDADPRRTAGGKSFLNGGAGGRGCYQPVFGQGGFGGGGGAGGCGGAGGGGYSGGGGSMSDRGGGGGGGSFNIDAQGTIEAAVNSGQGRVSIDIVL